MYVFLRRNALRSLMRNSSTTEVVKPNATAVMQFSTTFKWQNQAESRNPLFSFAAASVAGIILGNYQTVYAKEDEALPEASQKPADSKSGSPELMKPWEQNEEFLRLQHRRMLTEHRLRAYVDQKEREFQAWAQQARAMGMTEAQYEQNLEALAMEVNATGNLIMYGIEDPHVHAKYMKKYGYVHWTDEALQVLVRYSPILEIGAGAGHWQAAATAAGADVLAYDDMSSVAVKPPVGTVLVGNETEARKAGRRTLLLVGPPPGPMAANCLANYRGNVLIYVGEPRGGVNADDAFFDAMKEGWEVSEVIEVDPFYEGYEKMYVLKRKRSKRFWWW